MSVTIQNCSMYPLTIDTKCVCSEPGLLPGLDWPSGLESASGGTGQETCADLFAPNGRCSERSKRSRCSRCKMVEVLTEPEALLELLNPQFGQVCFTCAPYRIGNSRKLFNQLNLVEDTPRVNASKDQICVIARTGILGLPDAIQNLQKHILNRIKAQRIRLAKSLSTLAPLTSSQQLFNPPHLLLHFRI